MALNGKKRKFANAVVAGKSNKDAAIEAGYSPATASQAGSRLVKDKDVAEYIERRRAEGDKGEDPTDELQPKFDLGAALAHRDPKTFLIAAMNDVELDQRQRIDAAKALMPFMHQRIGESGKKEEQAEKAKKVASKFATATPPKLVAAGGKKVP